MTDTISRGGSRTEKVMLHPSLVGRLGKHCTTILDEAPDRREQGEYRPGNVQADTLPVFA